MAVLSHKPGADETGKEIAGPVKVTGSGQKKCPGRYLDLITAFQELVGHNGTDVSDIHEMPAGK
jgi:hypothetical protein